MRYETRPQATEKVDAIKLTADIRLHDGEGMLEGKAGDYLVTLPSGKHIVMKEADFNAKYMPEQPVSLPSWMGLGTNSVPFVACSHDWPTMWHGMVPPTCTKCGAQAPASVHYQLSANRQ